MAGLPLVHGTTIKLITESACVATELAGAIFQHATYWPYGKG
eukprot:gene4604-24189_t